MSARGPTLDELRARIAGIMERAPASSPAPPADPTVGELPFLREETALGPRYVRRIRSLPAARVGRFPLVAGRDADPAILALLALDPALAACDPRRALYLDTETTGPAIGASAVAFLIGLAWFDADANTFLLEQVLLRRPEEEAPLLALFAERVSEASMLVSFNGKSFDSSLLLRRFRACALAPPAAIPHLDLVHVARRIHKTRLTKRTLAQVESKVLGRQREGDVTSGAIVATYRHFLRTGDEASLLGVIEHNAADVLSMVALVGLYGEPFGSLGGDDQAGAARVLRKAGALAQAAALADEAVARGGGVEARKARGEIARARGDKARALADYEALAAEVDDPAIRLALSKLYEHHVRAFGPALALVEQGTGEAEAVAARRKARLAGKMERAAAPKRKRLK